MKKRKKLIILLIVLVLIALLLFGVYKLFTSFTSKNEITILHEIDGYGYKLEDRDYPIYKNIYDDLEIILDESEIDYEKYAESIGKLYLIDLYTLDNKISKYDVGGAEFVLNTFVDNYTLKVSDTMYKELSLNNDSDLPEVTDISLVNLEEAEYEIGEDKYSGYTLDFVWEYKKDLGYDYSASVIIINKEDKLYVVEHTTSEE